MNDFAFEPLALRVSESDDDFCFSGSVIFSSALSLSVDWDLSFRREENVEDTFFFSGSSILWYFEFFGGPYYVAVRLKKCLCGSFK